MIQHLTSLLATRIPLWVICLAIVPISSCAAYWIGYSQCSIEPARTVLIVPQEPYPAATVLVSPSELP
jgi:hypothetical protein